MKIFLLMFLFCISLNASEHKIDISFQKIEITSSRYVYFEFNCIDGYEWIKRDNNLVQTFIDKNGISVPKKCINKEKEEK